MEVKPNPSAGPQSEILELAVSLFKQVYILTADLPPATMFKYTMALRSAAMSLPPAIAEAELRLEVLESMEFFTLALGYLVELKNQLAAVREIGPELAARFAPLVAQVQELGRRLEQRLASMSENG